MLNLLLTSSQCMSSEKTPGSQLMRATTKTSLSMEKNAQWYTEESPPSKTIKNKVALSLRTIIVSDVDVSVDIHTVLSANFSDIQCYIKRCTSKLHHSKINRAQKLIRGTLYCGETSAAHITTTINSITHFAGAAIFGHFSCRGKVRSVLLTTVRKRSSTLIISST